jgi:hypothetical protein
MRFRPPDNLAIVSHIDIQRGLRQPLRTERSHEMTSRQSSESIRTTAIRGWLHFVSFTGRYACGRPENLLKH